MTFEELKRRLALPPEVDLNSWYERFQQACDTDLVDLFLYYLFEQGVVDRDKLLEVHAADEVEITKAPFTEEPPKGKNIETSTTQISPNRTDAGHSSPTTTDKQSKKKADAGTGDIHSVPTVDPNATQMMDRHATIHGAKESNTEEAFSWKRADDKNRYELLGKLGAGAMGEVHLAKDLELRRKVAIKKMMQHVACNRKLAGRFFGEVQITAQLDHPNIVPIYGLENMPDNTVGYAMKLVQGRTLKQLVQEAQQKHDRDEDLDERLSLNTRLDHFLMVCEAMAYAHSKGVIHRDLKPENIMVGQYNQVYVMDWGICRVVGQLEDDLPPDEPLDADTDANQTQFGTAVGTMCYMSPEQAAGRNQELDGRSDQYALGLILYELVSLQRAVVGQTLLELRGKALRGEKEPLEHYDLGESIPADLEAIIHKATALRPVDRYRSVSALAEDVRLFLHNEPVSVRPDKGLRKVMRWMSRHRTASLLLMLVLLMLGAGGTISSLIHSRAALAAASRRESNVNEFLMEAAQQSHEIDNRFFFYEMELQHLAGRAATLLAGPVPDKAQFYLDSDFAHPDRRPDDVLPSPAYHTEISLEWPVMRLAPQVQLDDVKDDVLRLTEMQPIFLKAMLSQAGRAGQTEASTIAQHGVPFRWVFVSLENGLHCGFPGKAGYPENYDGRQRPFYLLAARKRGIHWGTPYSDALGQGLLLACSTSIYDTQDEFRGIVGCDLTFDYLIDHLLGIPNLPYLHSTYLVNAQGEIVVDSLTRGKRYQTDPAASNSNLKLEPLPYPEVIPALSSGTAGNLEVHKPEHRLIAYYPIHALGWHYVAVADVKKMLTD